MKISPEQLKELVLLFEAGKIKMNLLKSTLEKMLESGKSASELISQSDMGSVSEEDLRQYCRQAIEGNPNAVRDYLGGKEKALKALLGHVMKATRGRADAQAAEAVLIELIRNS